MTAPAVRWFDAHLDLACVGLESGGRDMSDPDPTCAGGPNQPAAVTFPSLFEGKIGAALVTIFVEADGADHAISYTRGDVDGANQAGRRQINLYKRWIESGFLCVPGLRRSPHGMRAGILIEGADVVRSADDLAWWRGHGVVAMSLTWVGEGRAAGGNTTDTGISPFGRDLVHEAERLGIVLDLSHGSDRTICDVLSATPRMVIASHSNSRTLIGTPNQRHLRDDVIAEITRRGGVIGLNLFSPFLVPGGGRERRATIGETIAHVERVCEIAGHRKAVGLGSDMDGGFSAAKLPEGIDLPVDLMRLADALHTRGWSDDDIRGFAWDNWARIFPVIAQGA